MFWWLLFFAALAFLLWRRHRARQPRTEPAPAPRELGRRPEPPQRTVTETVSVVLRRQVPPRDEAPRCWLGGLPMLPDDAQWPRSVSAEYPDRGARPLHFVAQIACADLPAELWGGLGPRAGWLLFFVDPNQGVPEGPDAFRVIHVDALGSERAAPDDLGPVHDGVYTGPSYDYCRPGEVPAVWRRWPVDLVTVPNTIREVGNRTVAAPEDLNATLYPGQPIADDRFRAEVPAPFTWRGALYMLNSLERSYSAKPQEFRLPHETVLAAMRQPDMAETLLKVLGERDAQLQERQRAFLEGPEPAEESERKRWHALRASIEDRRRQRAEIAAFLQAHPTADSILDYFRKTSAARQEWHAAARDRISVERSDILARDLDGAIDDGAWQAVKDRLQQDRYAAWTYDWVEWNGARIFGLREVVSQIDFKRGSGIGELIADYYIDPARRSLVSTAQRELFEPLWRRLEDNIPHRLGGYHDGVQSDAQAGPQKEVLLFQIASDPAMNWCWGDVGAYYVFIAPDDLERGDFSRATMTLECH